MGSIKEFFGNIIDKIEDAKESVFGDVFSKYEDAKAKKKLEQDEAEIGKRKAWQKASD